MVTTVAAMARDAATLSIWAARRCCIRKQPINTPLRKKVAGTFATPSRLE